MLQLLTYYGYLKYYVAALHCTGFFVCKLKKLTNGPKSDKKEAEEGSEANGDIAGSQKPNAHVLTVDESHNVKKKKSRDVVKDKLNLKRAKKLNKTAKLANQK